MSPSSADDRQATTSGGAVNSREATAPSSQAMVKILQERLFYIKSFKLYDGAAEIAGLYDYGPPGVKLKNNVLAFWRQHFVLEENMLQSQRQS